MRRHDDQHMPLAGRGRRSHRVIAMPCRHLTGLPYLSYVFNGKKHCHHCGAVIAPQNEGERS